jgi:hypothetical protein
MPPGTREATARPLPTPAGSTPAFNRLRPSP